VATIACCFVSLAHEVRPAAPALLTGMLVPAIPAPSALLVVVAIVGATVMPHNLFLHSVLVKQRCEEADEGSRGAIGRFFRNETIVALNFAAAINGAILVVGASLPEHSLSIEGTFRALGSLHGIDTAALFGAALLLSGIAASATATLSGDYICAAFAPFAVSPVLRHALTLLPAAGLLLLGVDPTWLLLGSQTALCLILPAAIVPLLIISQSLQQSTSRRGRWFSAACVAASAICIILDVALLVTTVMA
jgi:manganese transport protein